MRAFEQPPQHPPTFASATAVATAPERPTQAGGLKERTASRAPRVARRGRATSASSPISFEAESADRRGWPAVGHYLAVLGRVNALAVLPTALFLFDLPGERTWDRFGKLVAMVFVLVNVNFLLLDRFYHYFWAPFAGLRKKRAYAVLAGPSLIMLGLIAAVVGLNFLSVIGVSMPSRWGSIVAISVVFSVIYGIAFFRLEDSRKNRRDTLLHLEASQGRERELEQLRATAEIRALQALMEPHFVFNTLNSIAALIHDQPDRAEATTLGLARLTRQILDIRLGALATLATEIALVRDYLEIEQTRMGGRLRYEISVPDGLLTHPVPPLLLQPMVENAVKHGVRQRLEDGCVWLVAREVKDALEIQIIDNGPGFSTAKGTGSGMSLVQDRLERIYGDAAEVRLERDEGAAQTVATLKIPTSAAPPGSSAPRAFPGRAGARPDPHLGAT